MEGTHPYWMRPRANCTESGQAPGASLTFWKMGLEKWKAFAHPCLSQEASGRHVSLLSPQCTALTWSSSLQSPKESLWQLFVCPSPGFEPWGLGPYRQVSQCYPTVCKELEMSSLPALIPHRYLIATPLPQAQTYLENLQWHGRIRLISVPKALSHRPRPTRESKRYSPRSAFSFRMSLKFKPLLSVDCLYLVKASFCPFFPPSMGWTGSARKPHFHLEKSDCAHFAKSSSFTVTFSETAITSSCKKWSDENTTCHSGLPKDWESSNIILHWLLQKPVLLQAG